MGLMDNIKKAQEMAQQAQQQSGGAAAQMPDAADMQYAQLAQKIATGGLPGVATINKIGETGNGEATRLLTVPRLLSPALTRTNRYSSSPH